MPSKAQGFPCLHIPSAVVTDACFCTQLSFEKIYLHYSFESFMHSFYIFLLHPLIPLTAPRSTHTPHSSPLLSFLQPTKPSFYCPWLMVCDHSLGCDWHTRGHTNSPSLTGCQLSIIPQLGLVVYEPHPLFASSFLHACCESELW